MMSMSDLAVRHQIRHHNDMISAVDVNDDLCPFTFASGDCGGNLALWKFWQANSE